jgi:hypothetical protein
MTRAVGTNGRNGGISGHDVAGMIADPSGSRLDELYAWMDEAEAELGSEDPRVARHNELFDVAITGLADLVRLSPHDELERMIAAQIVAVHAATMDCYRRSRTNNLEHRRENLNHAKQLTRAFVMLSSALQRNRDKAHARGEARPPSDVEIPPRVPPRRARPATRDRAAAGAAARWKITEQPHAKATAREPKPAQSAAEPPGTVNVVTEGPYPRVERVPVEQAQAMAASAKSAKQPHAKDAGTPGTKQPHAKEAGAPGAVQVPPAEVNDRPWADPARWGKDPRAGAGPRRNAMHRGAGAKREK